MRTISAPRRSALLPNHNFIPLRGIGTAHGEDRQSSPERFISRHALELVSRLAAWRESRTPCNVCGNRNANPPLDRHASSVCWLIGCIHLQRGQDKKKKGP